MYLKYVFQFFSMYPVVFFHDTNDVDVVATNWVSNESEETLCYWPSLAKPSLLTKAVKMCTTPAEDWSAHPCRVLFKTG